MSEKLLCGVCWVVVLRVREGTFIPLRSGLHRPYNNSVGNSD